MAEQQENGSEQSDFQNNTEEDYPPSKRMSLLDCEIVPDADGKNVAAVESLSNSIQAIIRTLTSQPAEPMLKFRSIWVNLERLFLKMSVTDVEELNLEFQRLCLEKIQKNKNC